MISPDEVYNQINRIVGFDIRRSDSSISIGWKNRDEGKALIQRIRVMQKELKLLKQQVSAQVSAIKSDFTSARTAVGKSFGAGAMAGVFGRKTMGRADASDKDSLRRKQVNMTAPYEGVKGAIDRLNARLDEIKGQIELSPEYQLRAAPPPMKNIAAAPTAATWQPPPKASPPPLPKRYYFYLGVEVKGPYTVEQIRALQDAGSITSETLLCPEGGEGWTALDEYGPL